MERSLSHHSQSHGNFPEHHQQLGLCGRPLWCFLWSSGIHELYRHHHLQPAGGGGRYVGICAHQFADPPVWRVVPRSHGFADLQSRGASELVCHGHECDALISGARRDHRAGSRGGASGTRLSGLPVKHFQCHGFKLSKRLPTHQCRGWQLCHLLGFVRHGRRAGPHGGASGMAVGKLPAPGRGFRVSSRPAYL